MAWVWSPRETFCCSKFSRSSHFFILRKQIIIIIIICSKCHEETLWANVRPASHSESIFKNLDSLWHKVFLQNAISALSQLLHAITAMLHLHNDLCNIAEIHPLKTMTCIPLPCRASGAARNSLIGHVKSILQSFQILQQIWCSLNQPLLAKAVNSLENKQLRSYA